MAAEENGLLGSWKRLGAVARTGVLLGAAALLAVAVWLASSAFKVEYRVLFSDLAETDAAAIVEQLKASSTVYRLADGGRTILVPAEGLYDTRLALMSSDTPLTGGVGFEIFDNQGLGATEQSQRVSYQRALQGELARTITTLDNVKQARVHLVLPDSTLFKRDKQEPRAAVTLHLKTATPPTREQITGVQRLVAASVAGLDPAKVVIVDQRGVTLSGLADVDAGGGSNEARLTTKRDVEGYLTRKITALLDEAYGPGQTTVSVDVSLNFDEIHRTVQDLLPVRAQSGDGRVLPHVQVNSGSSYDDPSWAIDTGGDGKARAGNSTTRVEYEYGRRVEQVIAAPGGITRVSIGVIVSSSLDAKSLEQIRQMVKVVAGVDEKRGDEVIVRTLADLGGRRELGAAGAAGVGGGATGAPAAIDAGETVAGEASEEPAANETEQAAAPPAAAGGAPLDSRTAWLAGVVVLVVVAAALAVLLRARARPELSAAERERLLAEIRRALGDDEAAGKGVQP